MGKIKFGGAVAAMKPRRTSLELTITRADGTVIVLGEVAATEHTISGKFFALIKRLRGL